MPPQWRPRPTGNPQTDEALRIFGDYIYQLRDSTVPTAQTTAVDKGAAKAVAQVTELIAAGVLTPGTTPAVVVDTHAHRAIHPPSQGTFYFETDRDALYVSSNNVPAVWLFVDDAMQGTLALRPGDLGRNDTGFLYSSTDALDYRWNGAAWDTLDDVRGGLTLTGVNTLPKVTAVGIIGPSAVTDDGALVTVTGRTTKLEATDIVAGWGALPLATADLALGAWGTGAHTPDAASTCWGDGSGWKWSLGYNNTGTFASRYDILDSGEMRFLTLTASRPAKLNANKGLTSGLIDLGSASDVAGTGLSANTITKWDGTKLVNTVAADFSSIPLAGDVTGTTGATVVSFVGGSTAALVHAAELLANAATSANTASAIVRRDGSGQFIATSGFFTTSIQVPGSSAGSVNTFNGSATLTGYIEWRKFGGTRLGYLGNDSANMTLNLENSATFVVAGGGAFVSSPANAANAVMTVDGVQTVTGKDLTATSNTFALPVIQRNDSIALTGQAITIGPTNLRVGGVVAPAGLYRVSCYLVCTSTGAAGNASAVVGWNDGTAARTEAIAGVALTATNFNNGEFPVRADGVNDITLTVTVTGAVGGPVYAVYCTLERLL